MVSDYKIIVDKKENVSILTHSPNGMFFFLLSLSLPLTTASMCMARPVI